ncbi:Protein of unknown function [Pyronema omphalodes CBS 100304]|uniref:Uncharacterized protein n=1 Tax=Pyronema omphalodes (strain CBS 100304) TaxID=1076935 RepID=U4LQ53_PYROM|nr:Protein of unknown function [Pyronema omphalodes CBS 100304]
MGNIGAEFDVILRCVPDLTAWYLHLSKDDTLADDKRCDYKDIPGLMYEIFICIHDSVKEKLDHFDKKQKSGTALSASETEELEVRRLEKAELYFEFYDRCPQKLPDDTIREEVSSIWNNKLPKDVEMRFNYPYDRRQSIARRPSMVVV